MRRLLLQAAVLICALLQQRSPAQDGLPTVEIPISPTAFPGGGKRHIVYELRIMNSGVADISLKQIDVLADGPLATFAGRDLKHAINQTRIAAGTNAVAYLWVTLNDQSAIPTQIRHKLTFDTRTFEGAVAAVTTEPLPVLGPPLRGEAWVAVNGPANESVHRRALLPINGKSWIAQRFAIDWVQLGANGSTHAGNAKDNKDYRAYGAEALAVADAVVASTHDGIPENVPGEHSRAVKITLETAGGNNILLDLGHGRYAWYAHLQPGSLRVKPGDRVHPGQVLGLVGNSGNSTEPHLHFHVSDRNSSLESEGVPYIFETYEVRGKDKKYQKKEKQLPLENEIVRFE